MERHHHPVPRLGVRRKAQGARCQGGEYRDQDRTGEL